MAFTRLKPILARLTSLAVVLWPVAIAAQTPPTTTDPWEAAIAAFEAADRLAPPPMGGIVFVGSSTIRLWDVRKAFPEYPTINRGFGGSDMADATRFVDRIVTPYQPRLVVVYAGDNDISGGTIAERVVVEFERFVRAVHAKLPHTRIVYIGIKPSLLRWMQIDRMRAANAMIRALCERDDRLAFVDVDQAMLGWDETPRPELYVADGLHLTPEGYQVFNALVRPLLAPPPSGTQSSTR